MKFNEFKNTKLYCFISSKFAEFIIFCSKINKLGKWQFNLGQTFSILFVSLFVALFSLIRGNVSYGDDIARTVKGYGLNVFSRPSSEFLSHIVHTDSFLADISPLTQLIAIAVIAISCILLLKVISGKSKFSLWQIASVLPLGINPFFLECLSFKFDSPYMAVSVLASIIPVLLIHNMLYFFCITFICVLIICTTYQVSLGIFPMVLLFTLLSKYIKGYSITTILKIVAVFALSFILSVLVFKFFIMTPKIDGEVTTSVAPLVDLPSTFMDHMRKYFGLVSSFTRRSWKNLFFIVLTVFFIVNVVNSKHSKIITFIMSLCVVFFSLSLTYGFYACLDKPLFSARALYGIGGFVACLFVYTTSYKDLYISKVCSVILSWSLIVFAAAYGNAIVLQRDYETFRIQEVINSVASIENKGNAFKYKVEGNLGHAPSISNLTQRYPLISVLVPISFGQSDSFLGILKFSEYYGIKNMILDNSIERNTSSLYFKETMYHKIDVYKDNNGVDVLLITLK